MLQRSTRLTITCSRVATATRCIASAGPSIIETSVSSQENQLHAQPTQEQYKEGRDMFLNLAETISRRKMIPAERHEFIKRAKLRIAAKEVVVDQQILKMVTEAAYESNTPSIIPFLIKVGRQIDVRMELDLCERICEILVTTRHWRELEVILQLAYKRGFPLSSKVLNAQLRLHLHAEKYSELQPLQVERFFAYKGRQLDRESFNILIEAQIANRDLQTCRKVVIWMENSGFPINNETHRAVLARMATLGPNQGLEGQIFASLRGVDASLDVAILNRLIRLRSIARDDAAIREYMSLLQIQSVESADGEKQQAIQPNLETIALLIEHFARRRNLDGALAAFGIVQSLGLKSSPEVIAHMITAYGRCRQLQQAFALTAALFDNLPSERRHQLYGSLKQLGWDGNHLPDSFAAVPVNIYILNALLATTLQTKGLDAAAIILDIMKLTYIAPDMETARHIMLLLNKTKSANSAAISALLYRLSEYSHTTLGMRHLNILHHALLREEKKLQRQKGGWNASATFLALNRERILRQDPRPATLDRVYRTFSILDGKATHEEAATRALRRNFAAVDRSAKQDHATYSLRMLYHARVERNPREVENLYEEMLQNDLRPNAYHIAALIEVYCNTRQLDKAKKVLFTACAEGIQVNRVLYTLLIQAYGNNGDPDSGREIYRRMLADRVMPDAAALEVMTRGYFMIQEYEKARGTLAEFWSTVMPPESFPSPLKSLSQGLHVLRKMEKLMKPPPPTNPLRAGPLIKEITKKWRRTTRNSRLGDLPPVIRRLRHAIDTSDIKPVEEVM